MVTMRLIWKKPGASESAACHERTYVYKKQAGIAATAPKTPGTPTDGLLFHLGQAARKKPDALHSEDDVLRHTTLSRCARGTNLGIPRPSLAGHTPLLA